MVNCKNILATYMPDKEWISPMSDEFLQIVLYEKDITVEKYPECTEARQSAMPKWPRNVWRDA